MTELWWPTVHMYACVSISLCVYLCLFISLSFQAQYMYACIYMFMAEKPTMHKLDVLK